MLLFRASQVPAIQQAFHASMIQCHVFSPHMSHLFYSPHLRSLRHKSTVQAPLSVNPPPHCLSPPPLNELYPTVTTDGTGQ